MRAIDGDHLKRWIIDRGLKSQLHPADIVDQIDRELTIEPERKTGKWIRVEGMNERCSVCNQYFPVSYFKYRPFEINFCPECGADMRGEENDES